MSQVAACICKEKKITKKMLIFLILGGFIILVFCHKNWCYIKVLGWFIFILKFLVEKSEKKQVLKFAFFFSEKFVPGRFPDRCISHYLSFWPLYTTFVVKKFCKGTPRLQQKVSKRYFLCLNDDEFQNKLKYINCNVLCLSSNDSSLFGKIWKSEINFLEPFVS